MASLLLQYLCTFLVSLFYQTAFINSGSLGFPPLSSGFCDQAALCGSCRLHTAEPALRDLIMTLDLSLLLFCFEIGMSSAPGQQEILERCVLEEI